MSHKQVVAILSNIPHRRCDTMKALIRKYPTNAHSVENNEVWFPPWRDADENGVPYTLEGYRYALCENVPDSYEGEGDDPRMDVENYTVEEHERTEGEGEEARTVRYWTAVYKSDE